MRDAEILVRVRARANELSAAPLQPATEAELSAAERAVGFTLHPFHRRLLGEVANGGFGPGAQGIHGVARPDGAADEDLVSAWRRLRGDDGSALPDATVPLCDFGCGCWVLAHAASPEGRVRFTAPDGVFELPCGLVEWFEMWLDGVDLHDLMFDDSRAPVHQGTNPFTRQPIVMRGSGPPRGALVLRYDFQ